MLEKNNLPLLSHYIKHDIKHIILGYETTDEGEVCLQSFMLGNGHLSFPVVITVVFGYLTMPEHWSEFLRAYNRGKISTKIKNWPWFQLILLPTQSLINKLNNHENT
jgi:ubiquinone biosynthesis protein Coq4